MLAAGALLASAVHAQQLRDAPWPSDVFNQKPQANVAGKFDYYTLVMSWSPTHCVTAQEGRDEEQCARVDGLRYGFVLHGLWPQYEKGYPEACRIGRKPFVPQPVINSMLDIMPSGGLVIHEYKLHGTCSGLDPAEYYKLSRQLFTSVRVPERFKNPFEMQFTNPREIEVEFMRANPWLRPDMIAVTCGGPGNRLRDVRIDYCWGGMVDMTRDRLPRAGERNGIYYSMGYSGHGTQMSTLMGTIMAEVMDGRVELNPWKDFDWPAIPGHVGPPWFLPLVGAYYRIKDRFQ